MRVMICGAGVAGVALACQLVERGHQVHLVERAPRPRDGGYMIDFFGPGYDTAERMGLLDDLAGIHQPVEHLIFVDPEGNERLRVPYRDLRAAFEGRHFNFPRGDLVRVLYERLDGRAQTRFGTTVRSYEPCGTEVEVRLDNGESQRCDLLVGADGIHSCVRRLLTEKTRETNDPLRFLGFHAMAFHVDAKHVPEIGEPSLYTWSAPSQVAMAFPESGKIAAFLAYAADAPPPSTDVDAMRRALHERYSGSGWIFEGLMAGFDRATDHYFDEVSQVELARWSHGRVVLLGDACQCVSLLAGQGASLAMGGAELLARELDAEPSVEKALAAYEDRMRGAVTGKQAAGRRIANWFVPATPHHVVLSRMFMRMLKVPALRKLVARGVDSSAIGNA